jgi:hypothetical protein
MDESIIKAKIKQYTRKRHALSDHWSNCVSVNLNQPNSDHTYKNHITRLRGIYQHKSNEFSNASLLKNSKPSTKTLLYGVNGLCTKLPSREKTTDREKNWCDDVNLNRASWNKGNSSKNFNHDINPSNVDGNDQSGPQIVLPESSLYRCDNDMIDDDELVVLGKYRMNERNIQLYADFIEMLSSYDQHDMFLILKDLVNDVENADKLRYYGGVGINYDDDK